ncbi:hypothetical protein R3P38DRAFT_2447057, partial [Favolaschia claudopus]
PAGSTNSSPAPGLVSQNRVARQTLLPGATQPTSGSNGKQGDRCALCVNSLCLRRHECPGRGNRNLCRCGHPPLTTKRARIPESKILAHWAKKA